MTPLLRAALVAAAMACVHGCTRAEEQRPARVVPQARPEPRSAQPAPWPAGPLRAVVVHQAFGLRLVGGQTPAEARALAGRLASRLLPGVPAVAREGDAPLEGRTLFMVETFGPGVPADRLGFFGRGLDGPTVERLSRQVPLLALSLRTTGEAAGADLRGLTGLVAEAARALGAVVEDPEARLYYAARTFTEDVAAGGFADGLPVVARHIAIHSYESGEGLIRSISVGMSKLGLPDVVANRHGAHQGDAMVTLVNLAAQRMAELGRLDLPGRLDLDLRALRIPSQRDRQLASLKKGAAGRTVLTVGVGQPEQGDCENRLLELTFADRPGTLGERQLAVLGELLGSEDSVKRVRHDDALLAASTRARAALLRHKPEWQGTTRPTGVVLQVKGPFRTPAGENEWMWIDVTSWQGNTIRGRLANDPFELPDLKAGATVEVEEGSVFDYLLTRADGTKEGNTTQALLGGE